LKRINLIYLFKEN